MSIDDRIEDGEDLQAAEYVLGLLDAHARREAEARLRADATFAADVARWEASFAPWLAAVPPESVPASVWPRVRSLLWSHELPQRAAAPAQERATLWQNLTFWRGLAVGGVAAAAASLAIAFIALRQAPVATQAPPRIVVAPPPQPAGAPMAVALRHDDGSIAYTASLAADGTLVLTPVQATGDPRAPELWLIPPGDRPHSLGMLPRDRAMAVRVPVALRAAARDGLFAISMEPPGSGPHEAPTGPVVAKGSMIAL
ncbi:MAG: hypothetical protein HOQ02_03945 [Lysobacter sp.]|nr:hypothetical protein [Lysobacter sp.]